jgi:hypothetical protein
MNNKQGGDWTEFQAVTHFSNTPRGEVLKWYNALPLMDVANLNWKNVRTQIEEDFRAAPMISSMI